MHVNNLGYILMWVILNTEYFLDKYHQLRNVLSYIAKENHGYYKVSKIKYRGIMLSPC